MASDHETVSVPSDPESEGASDVYTADTPEVLASVNQCLGNIGEQMET